MDSSYRFVALFMVLSFFVGYTRVNGRLFPQPVPSFLNDDLGVEEEEIVEPAPVHQPREPIQPPLEPNERSDIEEVPDSPVMMSSTTTNGASDDEEEVQSTTKTTKNPNKKREKSVPANEMLSEREKRIVIIAVILSVFIVCLVVCALCFCSTSKADDVLEDLTVLPPLPQPESGWTSICSGSGNEPTTRAFGQV